MSTLTYYDMKIVQYQIDLNLPEFLITKDS